MCYLITWTAGLDVVSIYPNLEHIQIGDREVAKRVTWVQANLWVLDSPILSFSTYPNPLRTASKDFHSTMIHLILCTSSASREVYPRTRCVSSSTICLTLLKTPLLCKVEPTL